MFKRRTPLSTGQTIKQLFWPSMGWKRSLAYIRHRVLRLADSTQSVALGLAIGLGVSFTPLLGTHFIQAGLIAFALRGNAIAAMIGTFIGNPFTFPFFWWAGYSFGAHLFTLLGIQGIETLPQGGSLGEIWALFLNHPTTLFLPWMLGGYVLAVISIPASYPIYFYLVKTAKIARLKALNIRREKRRAARIKARAEKSPAIKKPEQQK